MKWILRIVGALVLLVGVVVTAFLISPRPGAFILRTLFDMGNESLAAGQESSRRTDISRIDDVQYREGDPDAMLDVYFPQGTVAGERLPTLVWTHGGAWVHGTRKNYVPFFQSYANEGFTVVAIGYTLAPNAQYPTPVLQVNDALRYITANAERFHVDPDRIFMGGDSAGSQITSQIAVLTTSSDYARSMGVTPALRPEQLDGLILHCGFYDIEKFAHSAEVTPVRFLKFGLKSMVWAYTGYRIPPKEMLEQMSAYKHATAEFPPTFISGGNADPLTDAYSKPFAEKLSSMGVPVRTLFFPADHPVQLGHEYQFQLDQPDAQRAFRESVAFLKERATKAP